MAYRGMHAPSDGLSLVACMPSDGVTPVARRVQVSLPRFAELTNATAEEADAHVQARQRAHGASHERAKRASQVCHRIHRTGEPL